MSERLSLSLSLYEAGGEGLHAPQGNCLCVDSGACRGERCRYFDTRENSYRIVYDTPRSIFIDTTIFLTTLDVNSLFFGVL